MASAPIYYPTVHNGFCALTTAETSHPSGTGAPTNYGTLITGTTGTSTKVERIHVATNSVSTLIAATVVYLLYLPSGGSNYYEIDNYLLQPVTPSTTNPNNVQQRAYRDLILAAGDSLIATCTVTPASGSIVLAAFGGDA